MEVPFLTTTPDTRHQGVMMMMMEAGQLTPSAPWPVPSHLPLRQPLEGKVIPPVYRRKLSQARFELA